LTVTATQITATLTAKATAAPGAYTVTVGNPTGGGSGSCAGCLSVIAAPTITGVSPSSVAKGSSNAVTVTGTGFATGATLSGPKGVTYSGLTVVSATKITATMKVSGTAPTGLNLPITVTNTSTAGAGKGIGNVLTIT
jgi:hypothetical protein